MTQHVLIVKYTLLAFKEYFKCVKGSSHILNEDEFYIYLRESFSEKNSFMNLDSLEEALCDLFISNARTLCEMEALTFMSDENIPLYDKAKSNIEFASRKLNDFIITNNLFQNVTLTDQDWRKILAIADCFKEWTHDSQFFEFSFEEKLNLLKESPLISLCHL
ncbi:hypothetical protein [Silvanigrella aquatica]|uniref:Uncharacterized protein n=1 Tax=Silvanigrella aquatica TaxID=1915309 RepID=A0A1L4D3G0_9BACT|nr:hypothetical protein [Silvanigrella aquatica]APJ04746.1 hypothetical protein AXG55_12905 [Silvanigrella aquatica]